MYDPLLWFLGTQFPAVNYLFSGFYQIRSCTKQELKVRLRNVHNFILRPGHDWDHLFTSAHCFFI